MVPVEVVTVTGTQSRTDQRGRCDVVVVGGGVAGLSGALVLARARRSVLVVDAGRPRNAPAAHSQGFLTRDGTSPGELLGLGRAEVRGYGAEVRAGRAASAQPLPGGGFAVRLGDGETVRTRRLLVTTGVVDELPDVPGIRERWGRDVIHCPYCHGWEVRDQAVAVLGSGALGVHQALLFGQWTEHVTLFVHNAPEPTDEQWDQLSARGVTVVEGEVAGLVVTDDRLTGVRLASGQVLAAQAVVVGPRVVAGDGVLASLGLHAVEHPMGVGTHVPAGPAGLTAVPGVWVAGNVTDPIAGIVASAAAGSAAAAAINGDLIAEDTARAVAERATAPVGRAEPARQSTGLRARAVAGGGPVTPRDAGHRHGPHDHDRDTAAGDSGVVSPRPYSDQEQARCSTVPGAPAGDVVVNEARPRTVTDDQGGERTVHDAVLTARRRAGP
jgi:thioredoxin reductase